jgi:hypothetical protein
VRLRENEGIRDDEPVALQSRLRAPSPSGKLHALPLFRPETLHSLILVTFCVDISSTSPLAVVPSLMWVIFNLS